MILNQIFFLLKHFQFINLSKNDNNYSYIPKDFNEYNIQAFNPVIAHHWNAKWMEGNGITIYRRLAQYYIFLAGIWEETCKKYPVYYRNEDNKNLTKCKSFI
jgi:hypothetical protein